jgi:hypothetical protein
MNKQRPPSEFETVSARDVRGSFLRELWEFVKHNKKWWLLPLLVTLLAFGLLIFLSSGTGLAPFIYTLF